MSNGMRCKQPNHPEGEVPGNQDQLTKQVILDEYASVRIDFRDLVEAMSEDDLARRSSGTKWTNRELLFHMLFGYLVVRALVWFCQGRCADQTSCQH